MKKLLLLIFLTSSVLISQTPCENGFAGEYPCNDYDLLARIPISTLANTNGNPEGSDIWGWTDTTTGKEYALVATTNSTAFVDVSDPINPVFLGRLDSNAGNNFWRDVKIYNNHAFIVADNVGAHGMQVFDLTKLRGVTSVQNFTADAIFTGVGSCHNIVINETSGFAYLVGCTNSSGSRIFSGGPVFVDISDPKNPKAAGGYAAMGYTHDAQVITYNGPDVTHQGKELFIGSNGNSGGTNDVVVVDVTDKSSPQLISNTAYQNSRYAHQGWFTEDHKYFILGDELDESRIGNNTKTIVFDMTDLDNPQVSSTYFGPTAAIDHNGYVKGNLYFMANYTAGVRILDITNIAAATNSMTEVGYFDTYPLNNNTGFNGVWSVYPYFASGNIIISDIESGLFIIRKSGTLNLNTISEKNSFSIFPNPTFGDVTISAGSNRKIQSIQLFSIVGKKVVEKQNINQEKYVLETSNLSKGVYIARINNDITQKIILR